MLVLRLLVIIFLLIFIEDARGIEKRNPMNDDEVYTSGSSGSGQSNNDNNCDNVYTNYSDCSFQYELIYLSSGGLINITTDVTLSSIIPLIGLENIRIIGHDNPTVSCNNTGGIQFYHCHNCTIIGITWEKCGDINGSKPAIELYNCSNMIIENCTFQHSMTQAIILSDMLGNVTINGCTFAFNNHYEEHGIAVHYSSKVNLHSKLHFTISECNFTHNGMNGSQSVVYIGPSNNEDMEQIFITNSVFVNNQGTPLYISHQNVFTNGNILFQGNVANTAGGGIFISNYTNVIFHNAHLEFTYNEALNGGALHIDGNSDVTFEGNSTVTISNNYATHSGGALYIISFSHVTFKGNSTVTINNNIANFDGGASFIAFYSDVTFKENSMVEINDHLINYYGGAIYMYVRSNVIFEGISTVMIHNNQAGLQGGALCIIYSNVIFKGNSMVTINNNLAIQGGGALYIESSSGVIFEENCVVTINNNKVNNHDGGALYVASFSSVVFEGNSTVVIDNNQATYLGGALAILQYSVVTFGGNSTAVINNNTAYYDAGAIYIYFDSNIVFEGNSMVTVINNQGTFHGGAFVIGKYSDVTFGGNSIVTINNNVANFDGGAFYTENADVTFKGNSTVTINDNVANDDGGALYVSYYCNVIFEGNSTVTINNNHAINWGGAFWAFYNSDIIFKESSTVTIDSNTANNDGGAFYIVANSDVLLEGNSSVTISNNQAEDYGGALHIQQNSHVIIKGTSEVKLYNNTAGADGGVLYTEANCNVTIKGNCVVMFDNNVASGDGGAVFSRINSNMTFQENSTVKFNDNRADYFGGALCYKQNSNIIFEHNSIVTFDRNKGSQGGAIFALFNTVFKDSSAIRFTSNEALLGGAAYITYITFMGNTAIMFNNNRAVLNGGALYSDHSSIIVKQKPTLEFTQNSAENGGAIFTSTLLVSEYSVVTFHSNSAEQDGGAIYLNDEGGLIFDNSSTVTLISNTADHYGGAIYSNITQNTKYFNISKINFSGNTANAAGNLMYIDVPKSCDASCLTDRIVGISNGTIHNSLLEKKIATSPSTLKLQHPAKCIDNDTTECENYYIDNIMLGQEVIIDACVLDYHNNPAEVTQFHIIGEDHQNYIVQGSEYTSISCNHTIEGLSIVGNKSISDLPLNYSVLFTSMLYNASSSTRKIVSVNLTVGLSPCHPGFQYNSELQKCECYSNSDVVYCSDSSSAIRRGYWFGHVTGIQTVTFCPINYCNFTCCKTTNGYYHLSPVRVNQCRSHRSGSACGNCEEGYTLSFDSPECISDDKCTTGQTILVATLTVLYWFVVIVAVFIIMYYRLGIGYFYAVTYYYSVVDILLSQYTDLSNGLYIMVTIMSSVAKVIPQFLGQLCLFKGMSGIDQQFKHYLHPLAVSLILIIICWLARHFKRFSDFVSRGIIHAICFLLLLSYTSVATTSLLLMRSLTFADVDNIYTYLSPDTKYFHGRHLVYGIIAIILVVLIVIGLPLLLLLEPFLNSKINFIRIKPLLDQFQGCYKDKYRYFAGYYMICRLIIIIIIIANPSDAYISRYLLIAATTIIALLHVTVRPYTDNILNMSDGAILQTMILITSLSLFEYFDTFDSGLVIALAFVLVIIPLVQFIAMKIFMYRQTIKKNIKNVIKHLSFQRKTHQIEPNNTTDDNATGIDLIIDDNVRRSRNSSICEMYISKVIYYFNKVAI